MYVKYLTLFNFFKNHDEIINWDDDMPREIYDLIWEGMSEGIVESYCETETFMLSKKFIKWIREIKDE
jgi:hypothetical protein